MTDRKQNQAKIFEHLFDTDHFLSEIARVLKPVGDLFPSLGSHLLIVVVKPK